HLPRTHPPLAEPAASRPAQEAHDLQPDRAFHDVDLGRALGRLPARAAGRPLAGVGLPRPGFRGAPPAFDRARRRLRDGTRPRRDRVRLLGRAAAGDALPDELRLRPLPDPRQGARLLPVRLLRAARGRACIRGAGVRTGARPSENPDRGEAAQHLAHGSLRDDRGRRPPPRRRSRLDDPLGDPARRALPALDRACHVPRAALAVGHRDRAVTRVTYPKIELHVHLEGTVRPHTLLEIARRNDYALPADSVEGLQALYEFRDFAHFIEVWILTTNALLTALDFQQVVVDYAKEAASHGAVYVEGIFSPAERARRGVDWDEIYSGYCDGADEARELYGVEVRLTPDIPRGFGIDEAEATVRYAEKYRDRGVLGIGLGGLEAEFPPEPYERVFSEARAA